MKTRLLACAMTCLVTSLAALDRAAAADAADTDRAVFESAVESALPVTPEEVREFKRRADAVSRAAAAPAGTPPRPVTSSFPVDLSPGAPIPALSLGADMVSSLVFLDATGEPWPVERWDVSATQGQSERFKVMQLDANVLTVSSGSHYAAGNLAVKLMGLSTPVMVSLLQGGNPQVDYRKELHITRVGPYGQARVATESIPAIDAVLFDFLDNLPPREAQEKTVDGDRATRAWLYAKQLFVRTPATLLSPAWLGHAQASDGTHVYALDPARVLLVSSGGRMRELTVEH